VTVAALKYRLYGLAIASDFKLAEAETADFIAPDVTIVRGTVSAPSNTAHDFRNFLVTDAGDVFVFSDVGRFLVRGQDEIVVDLDDGFDERLVGLPLLGPVIAVLLHRRGNFILHGSCVVIDGQAEISWAIKGLANLPQRRLWSPKVSIWWPTMWLCCLLIPALLRLRSPGIRR
jgi:hypothetical protein